MKELSGTDKNAKANIEKLATEEKNNNAKESEPKYADAKPTKSVSKQEINLKASVSTKSPIGYDISSQTSTTKSTSSPALPSSSAKSSLSPESSPMPFVSPSTSEYNPKQGI